MQAKQENAPVLPWPVRPKVWLPPLREQPRAYVH